MLRSDLIWTGMDPRASGMSLYSYGVQVRLSAGGNRLVDISVFLWLTASPFLVRKYNLLVNWIGDLVLVTVHVIGVIPGTLGTASIAWVN